jgi:hypothetical protein
MLLPITSFGDAAMGTDVWPKYETAPADRLHATGVLIANFNTLEVILLGIFGIATKIPNDLTSAVFSKLDSEARSNLIKKALRERPAADGVLDAVEGFLRAFEACARNRNLLAHSIQTNGEGSPLFKFTRKGRLEVYKPSLEEIRRIADEIKEVSDYAMSIIGELMRPADVAALKPLNKKPPQITVLNAEENQTNLTRPTD